jgi:outer membrane protein assembly factor BamA
LKIRYENYQNFKDNNLSFGNIMVDARNYTSILRNLILASRVSYGSFLGNNKKYYMVGGMDNWVNQQINQSGNNNPLDDTELQKLDKSNLFFSRFITNIRGFDLNKLYGSDHLVFNAELRFPIIRALYQGTINSNFFRNLQFVAFTDVGAAWTGIHPFTQKNALNTEIIKGGPFDAKVYNFKDPFLVGYGFGMRSTMLGHYVKFDFAWGVEDGKQSSSPKFYLTLGYDF